MITVITMNGVRQGAVPRRSPLAPTPMRIATALGQGQAGIQAWITSCLNDSLEVSEVPASAGILDASSAPPSLSDGMRQLDIFSQHLVAVRSDLDVGCHSVGSASELDGSRGRYRRSRADCLLSANNDYEAIQTWVRTKGAAQGGEGRSHTQRAYLREAERLLLWSTIERDKPLSSLTHEDCLDYIEFLRQPEPASRWCGSRSASRWSRTWRPFEGPLSPGARRQTVVILNNLFTFLQAKAYLIGNAMAWIRSPRGAEPKIDAGRSFTQRQWAKVESALIASPRSLESMRLAFVLHLLYATGLRLSEVVDARLGDLDLVELDGNEVASSDSTAWMLTVLGKGGRIRQVPVPSELLEELRAYLSARGLNSNLRAASNRPLPMVARLPGSRQAKPNPSQAVLERGCLPLSQSGVYKMLKAFFARVAADLRASGDDADGDRFERASTHWLRHTHASHAIAHGMPLEVAQQNLGHTSLSITTVYVRTERDVRVRAVESFWGKAVGRR